MILIIYSIATLLFACALAWLAVHFRSELRQARPIDDDDDTWTFGV